MGGDQQEKGIEDVEETPAMGTSEQGSMDQTELSSNHKKIMEKDLESSGSRTSVKNPEQNLETNNENKTPEKMIAAQQQDPDKSSQLSLQNETSPADRNKNTVSVDESDKQPNDPDLSEEPDEQSTPIHEGNEVNRVNDNTENADVEELTEMMETDRQQSVDIALINKKRQEEKEVFQKLIDDVTRLEHEKENLNTTVEGLNLKIDVQSTELSAEKEKTAEQVSYSKTITSLITINVLP